MIYILWSTYDNMLIFQFKSVIDTFVYDIDGQLSEPKNSTSSILRSLYFWIMATILWVVFFYEYLTAQLYKWYTIQ